MLAMVALPFYLQQVCGYNDVATGLLLTAWPAVIMVVAPAAGTARRACPRRACWAARGLAAMAAGLFLLAFLPEHPTDFDIIWRLALCGAGFGLFQSPNNSILIASAPPERSGSASGMLATARLVGTNDGRRADGPAVPRRARKQHPHGPAAGGRLRRRTGAVVSLARISLPLPEGLTRRKRP